MDLTGKGRVQEHCGSMQKKLTQIHNNAKRLQVWPNEGKLMGHDCQTRFQFMNREK